MIVLDGVSKQFTLHNQGGTVIPVMTDASPRVAPGECVARIGASWAGKSTLMRMIRGNDLAESEVIMLGHVDVTPFSAVVTA